jgi:hypothetical protein
MRAPISLDLRNIKDPHVRSQFRKLADYVADSAVGNTSPALYPFQPGNITSVTNITNVTQVLDETKAIRFDDFTRRVLSTTNLANDPFDSIEWTLDQIDDGSGNSIRDIRAAADTTYPDTGVLVIDVAHGNRHIISAANPPIGIFGFFRTGTKFEFWTAVPSTSTWFEASWGLVQTGGGNYNNPDICVEFFIYTQPTNSYDSYFPPATVTYHGSLDTKDFIALRIRHTTGPVHDIYPLGKATDFMSAGLFRHSTLQFDRDASSPGNLYTVTASIAGGASIVVLGVDGQGNMNAGGIQGNGAGPYVGKLYVDAFKSTRPLPT